MGGFCLGLMLSEDQLGSAVQKRSEWDLILAPVFAPCFCLFLAAGSGRSG